MVFDLADDWVSPLESASDRESAFRVDRRQCVTLSVLELTGARVSPAQISTQQTVGCHRWSRHATTVHRQSRQASVCHPYS